MEWNVKRKQRFMIIWEDNGRTKRATGYILSEEEYERVFLPENKDGSLAEKPITIGKRATVQVKPIGVRP